MFARQNSAVNTNMAIQHPNIFYFVIDGSWSSVNSLEYWNKGNTSTTVNNNTVYKTIYSPSPSSFSEPKSAAFTGFTSSGGNQTSGFNVSGGFNKGWNFYCQPNATGGTTFFSALGFRDVFRGRVNTSNGGVVVYVSAYGSLWLAGPSSPSSFAHVLYFGSGLVNPQDQSVSAYGGTVRSVSE